MCEWLVYNKTQEGPEETHYAPGDVICCEPDGHPWGVKERSGKFRIVKKPGYPTELGSQYTGDFNDGAGVVKKSKFCHDSSVKQIEDKTDSFNKLTDVV